MEAPNIYHYSEYNFEYFGIGKADPDPMDPGSWLYPAYTTTIKPPVTGTQEVAVFNRQAQQWDVKPDWRKVSLWSKTSAQQIWPSQIQIGDTPDSLQATTLQPLVLFPVWKGDGWVTDIVALENASKIEFKNRSENALRQRRLLLDAIDLNIASTVEKNLFSAWTEYCFALAKVPQQAGWPYLEKLVWPSQPV
ncbi:tail fiber assembly protein [Chromobacterium vaccinii]|uniref:tail fiber assembly protein n=1 Tax=Chromobacterium vaccinii TaxID=1108595 RepID=UPI001E60FFC8|nr:tail fiber assembly protein [Chromobacterium vaccinii]MCD4483532.1 tail fiber assembly protein [Chromobacterium vaccinii]